MWEEFSSNNIILLTNAGVTTMTSDLNTKVKAASKAAIVLASMNTDEKNKALESMAKALDAKRSSIIQANAQDIDNAMKLKNDGLISQALVDRLKVDDNKIDGMIAGILDVVDLEDPTGKTLESIEIAEGTFLYKVSCPIGLIGVVFESRPDVVPQIMSLCLKSGNSIVFKGGSEAIHSNKIIFDILIEAIEHSSKVPAECFNLLESREEVMDLLSEDDYIDLVIPRGSNEFVKFIQDNTRVPVLGHADGVCHVYVDEMADLDKAYKVCFDSKVQYPAVCNAMETLLVNKHIAPKFLPKMVEMYKTANVEIRCDDRSYDIAKDIQGLNLKKVEEKDWNTEYNDLILSIKVIDSLDEAVSHINTHGSHHTDSIVTEDNDNKRRFVSLVDSSSTIINASTRFADGYRYGKGAEVGISTNKIHARGPVGMEGLVIYKYVLVGDGDTVADFEDDGCKKYTHKNVLKEFNI